MTTKEFVIYIKKQLNLTQAELSEKLKICQPTISYWENGWKSPSRSSLKKLEKFCKKYEIDMNLLESYKW